MTFVFGGKVGRKVIIGVTALVMMLSPLVIFAEKVLADMCTPNGRDCYYGYFTGAYDGGPGTLRNNVISAPAMLNVNNVDQLVATVAGHLGCGGGVVNGGQNGTGAAFIVLTMLGYPPGTPKNVACQQFGEWDATVRYWAPFTNYNVFYNFGGLNTRSSNVDVAWYPSAQTAAWSIVFYSPTTGQPLYAIKKDCANPVGTLEALERPRNYDLTPTVNSITPTQIEAGAQMSALTRVENTGEVDSQPTQWEITMITVQPGQKAPHEDEGVTFSPTAPCQSGGGGPNGNYFESGVADCRNVAKGNQVFPLGTTALNTSGHNVGDVPVGTRICFTLSVQPASNDDSNWAHAKPVCTTVGKKPKVQIWGGDVGVRGIINTSTSTKNVNGTDKVFGSWVEYGAFSVGANSRFASGSGLADQTDNSQNAWSRLTFANVNATGNPSFGQYAPAAGFRPAPGIASFFGSIQNKQAISGDVDVGSLATGNDQPVLVHTAGNLRITGGTIPVGRSVVIIATGTVTIAGNIQYDDASISRIQDIPQAVIIAQNINIEEGVTRIDGWLVASGVVNTCSNFTGNLTSNKCGARLEVNGPVVTNRLLLNRTAGSGTGNESGDPAERFNLRPDAHLWALLRSQGNNKAQTVYTVEMPPRF